MKAKNTNANFIIIIIIAVLLIISFFLQMLMTSLEKEKTKEEQEIAISNGTSESEKKANSIKEIIENAGSKYISMQDKVLVKIYVNFKCDLYDENGNSNEDYFMDIIKKIIDFKQDTFYLIDNEKNIEINVIYNKENGTYKVKINTLEDFYDETDGDIYVDIANTQIVKVQDFAINNDFYGALQIRSMAYANTPIVTSERELLPNGYYYYPNEHIKAKLGAGKVLNLVFDRDYEEEIARRVFVTTKLEDVEQLYSKPGFGGSDEGFLGYRSSGNYVFLYGDEISVYNYKYQANEYFDQYLLDYCQTGDLAKLVKDFTTQWKSYFEFEYDEEEQNLKLVYPTRGISINIRGNDSRGITIYNNYYLTDTVKDLIKTNKITLEPNKDLLFIAEQNRRESMK